MKDMEKAEIDHITSHFIQTQLKFLISITKDIEKTWIDQITIYSNSTYSDQFNAQILEIVHEFCF